jgi:FimV-like protein
MTAQALGILEPELKSYINEPLKIEIPLILTPREKESEIAIQQIVGKHPNIREWIPELNFRLISDPEHNFTIIATTPRPVYEPIVHFTLSIDTGFVWIQREMSFLLDPKPVQDLVRNRAKLTKPKVVLKPSEAPLREDAPAPSAPVPSAPVSSAPTEDGDASTYMIKSGDSLSRIAQRFHRNRGATTTQAMVAIFRANRKAFINDDVNRIKAHYEIIIPDEAQMKQLSSAEARDVFSNLLAPKERTTPQTLVADTPGQEPVSQPVPVPDVMPEEPAKPKPPVEAPTPQEETEIQAAAPDSEYELRLATDDAGISTSTINENEGTIVYEEQDTAASMATSPGPETKQAMRSAVKDMEEQLISLGEKIKNLEQVLQSRENQLALKTGTKLSSSPVEQLPAGPEPARKEPSTDKEKGPVELDISNTLDTNEDFDYLRLLLEILTVGAAAAFIGYIIIFIRKRQRQQGDEVNNEDRINTGKYFRPTFSRGAADKAPPTRKADKEEPPQEATKEEPPRKTTEEYIASSPRFDLDKKDSIKVTEEAYDDSIDFTHSSEDPTVVPDEDFNAEYILQEANLSIAFKDLENAHYQLTKLTNNVPANPEYRLLMLGVLRDMNREEEFIYHANHLANITNKAPNTLWTEAHSIGQQFLPNHPLFSSSSPDEEITEIAELPFEKAPDKEVPDITELPFEEVPDEELPGVTELPFEEVTDEELPGVTELPFEEVTDEELPGEEVTDEGLSERDDEAESGHVTPTGSPNTAVLDARRTLAEYEKKMREKEAAESSDEPDPASWGHFVDVPEESTASPKDSDHADRMIEMAEFSAIEGIPLDEKILKEMYGVEGDDKEEEDKEEEDKELDR